jgi:hypothetical protein
VIFVIFSILEKMNLQLSVVSEVIVSMAQLNFSKFRSINIVFSELQADALARDARTGRFRLQGDTLASQQDPSLAPGKSRVLAIAHRRFAHQEDRSHLYAMRIRFSVDILLEISLVACPSMLGPLFPSWIREGTFDHELQLLEGFPSE